MKHILSIVVLFGSMSCLRADDSALATKIDAVIKKEMEEQKLIGVAVGVIRDGKITYLKAVGEADRDAKTPATTETVFNWASNSKPLAAMLAMQLVEQGKLDLDEDVRKYVREFPDKKAKITTRHLLCHQSGIPHYTNGKVIPTKKHYEGKHPFNDPVNALDKFNQSPLIFEPGEKTAYSSHAYVLLSAVVQKCSQKPLMDYVGTQITTPLKMASFQWDQEKFQPNWATGYVKRDGAFIKAPDEAHDWKHGAGGFKSNVKDFARWAQALMNRELMKEETEKMMWTPQKTNDGIATMWGLGVMLGKDGRVSHGGSQSETKTYMAVFPKEKHGVVVMSNSNWAEPGKIAEAVLTAIR